MDLFQRQAQRERRGQPLAERMRPLSLEHFFGQGHLVGDGRMLREVIGRDRVPSLLLWGPPGSGKTTLARIIAEHTGARFVTLSATGAGVKDLRAAIARAKEQRDVYRKRTILFIDEIHRFNKAQQDALLPHVEAGTVTLMGATTENPSFEVNAALLSRTRVLRLEALEDDDVRGILERALTDDHELRERELVVGPDELAALAHGARGDARRALGALELLATLAQPGEAVTRELCEQALGGKSLLYDKAGEEHYNVVSALIKSMRGSDPDAAVYWMARMLEAGDDPVFVMRRLVIFAAEDIGNADPQALVVATAALDALRLVGLPEAVLPMTQAATYLATAPKSNSALKAYAAARKAVREHGALPVPLELRNAPTSLMRAAGYGRDYRYPHDFEGHYVPARYLPEALVGQRFYQPSDSGHERVIAERLEAWRASAAERGGEGGEDREDDGEHGGGEAP